jgi:disulfide bond formation protein DsbB
MTSFTETINFIAAATILILGVCTVILLILQVMYHNKAHPLLAEVARWSTWIGLGIALLSVIGSLIYSGVIGYAPCTLCWWQRAFIYPQVLLYGIALIFTDKNVFRYALAFSLVGIIFSLYHNYLDWGGSTLVACDASVSCTMRYVNEFGFVTIPLMSLITLVSLATIAWIGISRNR